MARKRGQNEGSIYKRQDGLWVAQVSLGSRRRVSKYFRTQREGLDWLREMRSQIAAGLTMAGSERCLSDFLEQWLGSKRASIRPKTLDHYRQVVKDHIVPKLGRIKLRDLRPDQIQALYNEKLNQGVSARSVIMIHAVLHASLKQALRWGIIGRNPVDAVYRPRFRRKEMRTLNDVQVRTLILVAKDTRYEALLWVAVATGLRQGEILGLRWSDIDWQARKLHVQRQLQRVDGNRVFTEPKSAAGRRVVVLGEATINVLRSHLSLQDVERQVAGRAWQENDLIFPSSKGTPADNSNLLKYFKMFLEKAGLPDIRFHDLRHTAATLMLQQGVHPKVVQERLGHADITLPLNTYSHVLPAMQDEAASKLDELLMPIEVSGQISGLKKSLPEYQNPRADKPARN